jgi:hypothetical protein
MVDSFIDVVPSNDTELSKNSIDGVISSKRPFFKNEPIPHSNNRVSSLVPEIFKTSSRDPSIRNSLVTENLNQNHVSSDAIEDQELSGKTFEELDVAMDNFSKRLDIRLALKAQEFGLTKNSLAAGLQIAIALGSTALGAHDMAQFSGDIKNVISHLISHGIDIENITEDTLKTSEAILPRLKSPLLHAFGTATQILQIREQRREKLDPDRKVAAIANTTEFVRLADITQANI